MWFTILCQLRFFSAGQLLIFTNSGLFFFFFSFSFSFWDIYGFTIGLSHTFTILYQLMFFSAGQLLIFTNNFFFFSGIYTVFLCGPPSPSPSFFFVKSAFSPNCEYVITYIYFFLKSKNLKKFLQFGEATWRNHSA